MIITDTHTHLYSEQFDDDRDQVIERALAAGVSRFFIPAIDSTYTEAMYSLEARYPNHMFLMTGVHPTHVKENYREELAHVEDQLKIREFVAIGEIGIDLYWDHSTLKLQKEAFRAQIQLAKPLELHPYLLYIP
jgi:TatD DNase family protein